MYIFLGADKKLNNSASFAFSQSTVLKASTLIKPFPSVVLKVSGINVVCI